jgi:hypothetical protein
MSTDAAALGERVFRISLLALFSTLIVMAIVHAFLGQPGVAGFGIAVAMVPGYAGWRVYLHGADLGESWRTARWYTVRRRGHSHSLPRFDPMCTNVTALRSTHRSLALADTFLIQTSMTRVPSLRRSCRAEGVGSNLAPVGLRAGRPFGDPAPLTSWSSPLSTPLRVV